jgi:hypothetical protein
MVALAQSDSAVHAAIRPGNNCGSDYPHDRWFISADGFVLLIGKRSLRAARQ